MVWLFFYSSKKTKMILKYTYNKLFQRNIGIFTKEEQKKIKKLKVAIAGGGGGLGSPMAYNIARLGVEEIRLADPDIFEPSNINRQFGAYIDTIGQYKVKAIKNELLRINPCLVVKIWNTKIDKLNIAEFLNGVDAVIDGIDFFELEAANFLYKEAFKRKLWVFTCQGACNIISFIAFNPSGITFEKMVSENNRLNLKKTIIKMFPILPKGVTSKIIDKIVKDATKKNSYSIPSYVVLPPIGGAFVTEELIKVLIRNILPLAEAPNLFLIDLEQMKIFFFKDGKIQNN